MIEQKEGDKGRNARRKARHPMQRLGALGWWMAVQLCSAAPCPTSIITMIEIHE